MNNKEEDIVLSGIVLGLLNFKNFLTFFDNFPLRIIRVPKFSERNPKPKKTYPTFSLRGKFFFQRWVGGDFSTL